MFSLSQIFHIRFECGGREHFRTHVHVTWNGKDKPDESYISLLLCVCVCVCVCGWVCVCVCVCVCVWCSWLSRWWHQVTVMWSRVTVMRRSGSVAIPTATTLKLSASAIQSECYTHVHVHVHLYPVRRMLCGKWNFVPCPIFEQMHNYTLFT